jgi:hypothetical protein
MRPTYAVTWQRVGDKPRSGRLDLTGEDLVFEGSNGDGPTSERVPYSDVLEARIARDSGDRISGRQTLILERRSGDPIRIASIVHPGIISELAEHLASRYPVRENAPSRAVLVLPLAEGTTDRVAALLRSGPPFDPEDVGLARHQVFLTESEAVFLFEADTPEAADRLLTSSKLWADAAAWKDLVAGPPRLADNAYSWVRPRTTEYMSFGATPGPGDSEGGDLY